MSTRACSGANFGCCERSDAVNSMSVKIQSVASNVSGSSFQEIEKNENVPDHVLIFQDLIDFCKV